MNYSGNRIQLVRAKTIWGNLICSKKYTTKEAIRLFKEDIRKGEVNTPEDLVKFFHYLVGGPYVGCEVTTAKSYRIKSISEDVVFAATSERRRPAKHLQTGIAIKSLTGSKKIVAMLNRLGHSINYNGIEELEMELTYNWSNANQIAPSGMSEEESCPTELAFDIYDRFTETLSGKVTLHDTTGIAYQTVSSTCFLPRNSLLQIYFNINVKCLYHNLVIPCKYNSCSHQPIVFTILVFHVYIIM